MSLRGAMESAPPGGAIGGGGGATRGGASEDTNEGTNGGTDDGLNTDGGIPTDGGATTRVSMRGALPLSPFPLDTKPLPTSSVKTPPKPNSITRLRSIAEHPGAPSDPLTQMRIALGLVTVTAVLVLLYRWLTRTKPYRKPATSPPPPLRVAVPRNNNTTISSGSTTAMAGGEGLKSPLSSGLRCRTPIHTPLSPPPAASAATSGSIVKTMKR